MVRYHDNNPPPLIMIEAHIVRTHAGQAWWSWRGHTYGPTPIAIDPIAITLTHQGPSEHIHQGVIDHTPEGHRCKVITTKANLADGIVIPIQSQ